MPLDQANWQINLLAADKTASAFSAVERRMKSLDTATAATGTNMASQMLGAVTQLKQLAIAYGVVVTAQALWHRAMKAGDIGEQAEQVGLSTDELQAYRLVAAQAGVSAEQLDGMMMKLASAMGSANDGNDEMIAKFNKLGVKILDVNGSLRKSADVMPELARGMLNVASATERDALMKDFLGRSGMRAVTMLDQLALGNDRLVASAKAQNAIIGSETIEAWDKLGDKLKVAAQRFDTLIATVGQPIAVGGLILLNTHLGTMVTLLQSGQQAMDWIKNGGPGVFTTSTDDLLTRQKTLTAMLENLKDSTDALDVAKVAGMRKELVAISDQLASRAGAGGAILHGDTVRFTGAPGGAGQPLGDKSKKTGESDAAARLRETQKQMDDLVASIEKVRQASEGVLDKYGNGAETAARKTAEFSEMLQMGFIDADTFGRAMKDVTLAADDQARAIRGAAGGFDGLMAGMEQAFADADRMNRSFEAGKLFVDTLSEAIGQLATGAEVNFGRILQSFLSTIIQMEARAAMSQIWGALGGGAGILGMLGLGGGGQVGGYTLAGNTAGQSIAGLGNLGIAGAFADGGNVPAGRPYMVGENGPEVRVDKAPGTIFNRDQLAGMSGADGGVTIHQTMYFGSDVRRAELASWAESTKRATIAEIVKQRRDGGAIKTAFR